ncbi:hypothetical protein [Nitratireductor basaltis]|uniref:DUF3137 domain-containing protein n=1 Tax=Nitratireductor basaltis TaxID=472175 RepID=A0A084U7Q6_9HYPH|nr:hypothetical protein [Nitratireductor basaltis]KFB08992.1 hypothetical protein EL18_00006 [Nitratireductor basaltis]
MSARRHWDPFEGEIEVETPELSSIRKGIALPLWLKRIPLPAVLFSLVWTMAAGFGGGGFPFVPVTVTTFAFGTIFLMEILENADGHRTRRRILIARDRNWSYTGKFLEWQIERKPARDSDGNFERRSQRVKPQRLKTIETAIPELTVMQAGSFMGVRLDGEFWGESVQDGLPLWVALGAMQMEAALGPRERRRDARGGRGGYGQFISLLGAYRIGRKTGIRAIIRPENIANRGPFDRDIKTESIHFNEQFHVSGRSVATDGEMDVSREVLQILTPATQATLLDLAVRFHTVGFVVVDDVLFFMAQDKLVGENASEGGIDRLLPGILEEFEAAKLSIKRYVE